MQLQSVADSLSAFADEEDTKDRQQRQQQAPPALQPLTPLKPKLLATPKLSGVRSRELHHQRVSATATAPTGMDLDMAETGAHLADDEDADEYVYDTYVLAAGTDDADLDDTFSPDAAAHLRSVGYIIITDADQAIWETYQDDEADGGADGEGGGTGRADDEDDENAEDWHGADYPDEEEDEDEDGEGRAYGYMHGRPGGADDEEWDADTGSWSDEEDARQRNPWKTMDPKEFVRRMREGAEG